MIIEMILAFGLTITWFINIFLMSFIVIYIKSKPLGLQTILDLIMIDTGLIWILFSIINYLIFIISIFRSEIGSTEILDLVIVMIFKSIYSVFFLLCFNDLFSKMGFDFQTWPIQ